MVLFLALSQMDALLSMGHKVLASSRRPLTRCLSAITDHSAVIDETRIWVERFVYGQRLCPWSGKVISDKKMRVVAIPQTSPSIAGRESLSRRAINRKIMETNISNTIMAEANALVENILGKSPSERTASQSLPRNDHVNEYTTTLIVLPYSLPFTSFLKLVNRIEDRLQVEKLDKHIQLASFHPNYVFADAEGVDDEGNWTNRSPYPTFHLLRVDEVAKAIESYENQFGSTSIIWQRNIERMRALGVDNLKAMMQGIKSSAETKRSQR